MGGSFVVDIGYMSIRGSIVSNVRPDFLTELSMLALSRARSHRNMSAYRPVGFLVVAKHVKTLLCFFCEAKVRSNGTALVV